MKTDLELRHLRVFATVAEVGTHTGAARVLGLSQSTVSETLTALERALGTPLFRRAGKGPMLTASGDALLPYARRMLALATELVSEVARVSTDVNATLVVAAVESLCAYVLPAQIAELRERWPKLRIEVVMATCTGIRDSVAAGKCDLGLVLEIDAGIDDDAILTKARLLLVGDPAHPLANQIASADQLRRCEFYLSDAAGDYHQVLRRVFDVAELPAPKTQSLGTIEGVKRGLLGSGTALGVLPAHAVQQELRDGRLVEIGVRPGLTGVVLRAVVAPDGVSSPMVEALIRSLRDLPLGGPPLHRG